MPRFFHAFGGLYFYRLDNGSVRIIQTNGPTPEDGGIIEFDKTIDDGTWGSIVLSMTDFSERPGDWQKWMDHHHGRVDRLRG